MSFPVPPFGPVATAWRLRPRFGLVIAIRPDPVQLGRMLSRPIVPLLAFIALGFSALALRAAAPAAGPSVMIGAADPRFHYEGRIDATNPAAPVLIWEASRVSLDFSGDTLGLHLAHVTGQVCFNVTVDGRNTVVDLHEKTAPAVTTLSGYGPGRHHLVVFKRTEASAGTARFLGVELAPGAQAWAAPRRQLARRVLFLGDSITVGACNEDGPVDQWEDRRTHDSALSYAALTAAALDARYENISVSGMGIVTGWVPVVAGEIWDRMYPTADSPKADLSAFRPQIVFINFGENDDSFTRAHNQPFPAEFTPRYVALVHAVRQAYPKAEIVLLRGGMTGGATSVPLRHAWEAAVKQLEASDHRVSHYVFKHWTKTHPRVADDRAMAAELVTWLRQQPFLR